GDDLFPGLDVATSSMGGFQVERLSLRPRFPAGTFSTAAPQGALDYDRRLQVAEARTPPFRAVIESNGSVEELSWLDNQRWREEALAGNSPGVPGGAGSFVVSSHGIIRRYNARDHSYSRARISANATPVRLLLPEEDPTYSTTACPVV